MTEPKSDHFMILAHLFDKLSATENVEMQMLYRLASVRTAVGDNTISAGEFFALGNLGDGFKDLGNERAVLRSYLINRRNMLLRHDKDMYGRLRIDIAEGVDVFVFIDL